MKAATAVRAALPALWDLRGICIMFLIGFSGMAIGMAIDLQSILPQTIASLCGASHTFGDSLVLHATLLPATNLLMPLSGLAAAGLASASDSGREPAPQSLGLYLACSVFMLTGMLLCEWLGPQLAAWREFPGASPP